MSNPSRSLSIRSPMLFSLGLVLAAVVAVGFDSGGRYLALGGRAAIDLETDGLIGLQRSAPLGEDDWQAARIAWTYIENNTRPETGMVDSVAGFASTTIWDQGSYLMALVAAHRLELIDKGQFDARASEFLDTLSRLPLFDGRLPNKAYDTRTTAMTNYQNEVIDRGIGWSALDVARMLIALRVLEKSAPVYGDRIRALLRSWDLTAMAKHGELFGAELHNGQVEYTQEGRIGYEQYGARAAAMWGLDVAQAISAGRILEWERVNGVNVPADLRDHRGFQAITPSLSEPYILQALEIGLDSEGLILANRIYQAQENRFRDLGELTIVSEDHIDQAPHFLYSSVFGNGESWSVVTEDGTHHPDLRTVSLKAAFSWDAIFGTEYTRFARDELWDLGSETDGWAAGRYESDGRPNEIYTLNTNAVVLEAIHFIAHGPLWQ